MSSRIILIMTRIRTKTKKGDTGLSIHGRPTFFLKKRSDLEVFLFSLLTVDVNNVMTQLSLVEIEADYDTSLVVEEYNPDCFVLVYAVDDRESFGKN